MQRNRGPGGRQTQCLISLSTFEFTLVVVAWNVNADRELMCVSLFVVLGTDSAERRTRRRLAQLRRLP